MKSSMNLEIRTNLIVLFSILFWSFSIILYVVIPSRVEEFALPIQIGQAKNVASLISANLVPFTEAAKGDSLKLLLRQLPEEYDLLDVAVADSTGKDLSGYPSQVMPDGFRGRIASQISWISLDGLILRVQTPIFAQGHEKGFVLVGFSLSNIRQEAQAIRILIVVSCLVIYIIGLFVISGIASMVMRPLRRMMALSAQLQKEAGEQMAGSSSKSKKRTNSIHEIADAMEFVRVNMDNINSQLEHRIEVRTKQLVNEIENRRKIEDQLHKLSTRLQSVREEERAWIAREIHDELGQALTGLKMYITGVIFALKDTTDAEMAERLLGKLQSMASLVDSTMSSIQKIVAELRPPILDKVGLVAGIEWHVSQFIERTNIHCEFNSDLEDKDIPAECATPLFRITQETMTNVARHANASEINIDLGRSQGYIVLKIRDNGKGITEEEIHSMNSLGLLGMRERISPLHGEVFVSGIPGKGTLVEVRVPVLFATGEQNEIENVLNA